MNTTYDKKTSEKRIELHDAFAERNANHIQGFPDDESDWKLIGFLAVDRGIFTVTDIIHIAGLYGISEGTVLHERLQWLKGY